MFVIINYYNLLLLILYTTTSHLGHYFILYHSYLLPITILVVSISGGNSNNTLFYFFRGKNFHPQLQNVLASKAVNKQDKKMAQKSSGRRMTFVIILITVYYCISLLCNGVNIS